jgi:ubiquinone/menaquinone biosynthesis C-methylase UbiE
MAVNNVVHMNECGLPLNAIEWLERHHHSKSYERGLMVEDVQIKRGSFIVDAGCGPGLWTPLLANATGPEGRILNIDISAEALITANKLNTNTWYRNIVQYRQAPLEQLPVPYGEVDLIFSANVSQYLPDPVMTFAAMGPYLKPGGRLVIKDIDFGTLRFRGIDPILQTQVISARNRWEQARVSCGLPFEDSWVGSKLASYLRAAGYQEVQEKTYQIVRRTPLPEDYRFYLRGIAEWFVCEGAPYLSTETINAWLRSFAEQTISMSTQQDFMSEETEYVVSGVWTN